MTTNCCGNAVPPVPEKPLDLNQPAYVLVDGQWVLLADVIEQYMPPTPPAETGAVLSVKHIVVPTADIADYTVNGQNVLISPVQEFVPSSPTSRLAVLGVISLTLLNLQSATDVNKIQVTVGLRNQTSVGVWSSDLTWGSRSAILRSEFKSITNESTAYQLDVGPSDRRGDDGKWAVGLWSVKDLAAIRVGPVAAMRLTVIEYEPS